MLGSARRGTARGPLTGFGASSCTPHSSVVVAEPVSAVTTAGDDAMICGERESESSKVELQWSFPTMASPVSGFSNCKESGAPFISAISAS